MLSVQCAWAVPGICGGHSWEVLAVCAGMVPKERRSDMTKRANGFITLGERVRRKAITMCGTDCKSPRVIEGNVVYIHPKGRFHVVEFTTRGGPVRESFAGITK